MFECHQIPVLLIELVEVSEIKELLVVLESALPLHFNVSRVHLGHHHVRQHCGKHIRSSHQSNVRTPIVVILSEISPASCGFNETLGAGIET